MNKLVDEPKLIEMKNLSTLRYMNEYSSEFLNNSNLSTYTDVRTNRIVHFSTCSKFEVICEILNKQEKQIISLEERLKKFMNEYTSTRRRKYGNTKKQVIKLYKEHKSIKQMSQIIGVTERTIEYHILDLFENDDNFDIDLDYFDLTEEKEEQIKKAIKKVGIKKLRPIRDIVGKSITYAQIKLCILIMNIKHIRIE